MYAVNCSLLLAHIAPPSESDNRCVWRHSVCCPSVIFVISRESAKKDGDITMSMSVNCGRKKFLIECLVGTYNSNSRSLADSYNVFGFGWETSKCPSKRSEQMQREDLKLYFYHGTMKDKRCKLMLYLYPIHSGCLMCKRNWQISEAATASRACNIETH